MGNELYSFVERSVKNHRLMFYGQILWGNSEFLIWLIFKIKMQNSAYRLHIFFQLIFENIGIFERKKSNKTEFWKFLWKIFSWNFHHLKKYLILVQIQGLSQKCNMIIISLHFMMFKPAYFPFSFVTGEIFASMLVRWLGLPFCLSVCGQLWAWISQRTSNLSLLYIQGMIILP